MNLQSRETQQEIPLAMSVFRARVHCSVVCPIVFSANQRRPCKSCVHRPLYRIGWCISRWPAILIQAALLSIYNFFFRTDKSSQVSSRHHYVTMKKFRLDREFHS